MCAYKHQATLDISYSGRVTVVQEKKRFLLPWPGAPRIHPDLHHQGFWFQLDSTTVVFRISVLAQFAWDTEPQSITFSSGNESCLSNLPSGLCSTNPVIIHRSLEQPQVSLELLLLLPHSLHMLAQMCHMFWVSPKTTIEAAATATAILWNLLEPQQPVYQWVVDAAQTGPHLRSENSAFVESRVILNEWASSPWSWASARHKQQSMYMKIRAAGGMLCVNWGLHIFLGTAYGQDLPLYHFSQPLWL